MRMPFRIALILGLALVLAACGRGTSDLERWVAEVKQRPAEPIEPIPTVRLPEPVVYAAHDLRDPFMRGRPARDEAVAGTGSGVRPDPDRRKEYLENFPLDTLAMVGTIQQEDQVWALIADNEGVVHRVQEGNYLGQNHGRIMQVQPDRVALVELIPDGTDGWMEREAQIALVEGAARTRRRR